MASEQKNILYGGPVAFQFDSANRTLGQIALNQFKLNGNKVLVTESISGQTLTANELRVKSIHIAKCLRAAGIGEGDIIGLFTENRLEIPIVVFAAVYLGATVAPFNISYTEHELNHAVNLSKPKLIFASGYVLKNIYDCSEKNAFIKKIICFDEQQLGNTPDKIVSLKKFEAGVLLTSGDEFQCKPVDIDNNIVLILCSSGTTGLPKGVQLSQANVISAVAGVFESSEKMKMLLSDEEETVTLSVIPWFHVYGLCSMMCISLLGHNIVTMRYFDEKEFLRAIEKYKVNNILGVPPLVVMLAKSKLVDNYDLSSLRVIVCGAAPLSSELTDTVVERLNLMAVFQGFGMSEMTLAVLQQTPDSCTSGSVGKLRPEMYGKIVHPDTNAVLGPNERGEMCFKGASIMKGYIGDSAATKSTIDADGWLHTGDIGYYNDDNEWFIVDRIKELIKYKGFQVPPAELEALLLTNDKIAEAAVIGIPDEASGELALGFVVVQRGAKLTEKEVIDFVAGKVSKAKWLHGGVRFVHEIPKNPSGKILRRELRELIKKSKL